MAKFSDTSVYPLQTSIAAADLILFHRDTANFEQLIAFSDFVKSVQGLIDRKMKVALVATGVTLDDTYEFVAANSASPITITIPDAASYPGQPYHISNKGAGDLTLQRSGTDHLDDQTSFVLAQWEHAILISDGVDTWHVFSNNL